MKKISYSYYKPRASYAISYRFPETEDYLQYQQGEVSKLLYTKKKKAWVKGKEGDIQTLRKVLSRVDEIERELLEVDKKIWIPKEEVAKKSPQYIEVSLNGFLEYLSKKIKEGTLSNYFYITKIFLTFMQENYPHIKMLHQLKEDHLKKYIEHGKSSNWKPKYLYEHVSFLKRFTKKYCIFEKELLSKDPFEKVTMKRPNKYSSRREALTDVDLKEYVCIFKEELGGKTDMYARIALLYPYCGLRRSELTHLKWRNIKEYKGQIFLAPEFSKTDKGMARPAMLRKDGIQYLPKKPKEAKDDDFIFPYTSRTDQGRNIYKYIKRRLKKNGLGDYCLHSLRHTYGTNLLKDGMRLEYVKEALGHINTSTTEIYLHSTIADVAKEMQKIETNE